MKNSMIKETKSELKKVIWPSRKDVINGTAVVAVMVVIVGIIILAFDFLSSALIKNIISSGDNSLTNILEEYQPENPVDENTQLPVEENSEPTIENNEVTE